MRNRRAFFDELKWLVAIIVKTCFAFALRARKHNLIPLRS
jgi:hypothetical protein